MFKIIITSCVTLFFSSCATVHSAYLTNASIPIGKGSQVEGEASKWVVFAFNFDNDYAYDAQRDLEKNCRGGRVSGILSTYETFWYVFLTKHVVKARGTCTKT